MKKENTIRQMLGMTQEKIAMLLGISRSQWAMFELGKRNLPAAAQQLLAELLTHVQSPETAKSITQPAKQEGKEQKIIENALLENQYQLLLVSREITALEKKANATLKSLHVTDFLSSQTWIVSHQ